LALRRKNCKEGKLVLKTPLTLNGAELRDADGNPPCTSDLVRVANAHDDLVKQLKQEYEFHRADGHWAVMCFRCGGMEAALRKAGVELDDK
jgi:hypothetical protein